MKYQATLIFSLSSLTCEDLLRHRKERIHRSLSGKFTAVSPHLKVDPFTFGVDVCSNNSCQKMRSEPRTVLIGWWQRKTFTHVRRWRKHAISWTQSPGLANIDRESQSQSSYLYSYSRIYPVYLNEKMWFWEFYSTKRYRKISDWTSSNRILGRYFVWQSWLVI